MCGTRKPASWLRPEPRPNNSMRRLHLLCYLRRIPRPEQVKMLEGPKESLNDMTWHPARPLVVSAASTGRLIVWAKQYQENYSAFAPNFKELEENEEYIEREDEFDLVDQEEVVKKKEEEEEAVEVDITTLDELPCQFADLDDELIYLRAVRARPRPAPPLRHAAGPACSLARGGDSFRDPRSVRSLRH
jgi:hypothetical protein